MIGKCCIPARLLKNYPISQHVAQNALRHACHILSSFRSTPSQTTPKFTAADRHHEKSHEPLSQQGCSLAIWLSHLFTQVMSQSPASTSTVSTRRSTTPRGEPAPTNIEKDFTFHQQAAASDSLQPEPASVVNAWLSADMWSSTGQLVRGSASIASDRDLESVQTLSERRHLHVYLEQKAELAVQGECAAQRRLSKAEADMDRRNQERRNSIALYGPNRELKSQRLELKQASQSPDQAQREKKINSCGELEMRNRLFQEKSRKKLPRN